MLRASAVRGMMRGVRGRCAAFSTTSGGGVRSHLTLPPTPTHCQQPPTRADPPGAPLRPQITRIHTENPNMSQTVIHSDTVYLAGQVPNDYSGDITAQTEETLAKVDGLLEEAGTDKSNLLQASIWVKTMDDFAAMNEARAHPSPVCATASRPPHARPSPVCATAWPGLTCAGCRCGVPGSTRPTSRRVQPWKRTCEGAGFSALRSPVSGVCVLSGPTQTSWLR